MKSTFYYKFTLFAILFAAVVVLLGAYTRLVDAGLGCPDWPGCYGFLTVPDTHEEIKIAEEAYPHASVETHKAWPEMVHRYFAGTLGLIIALLAFLAIKARKDAAQPLVLPLILLALVIFQAALGMWTVTMGLLPVVVMGHLLGGFTTLALLWLLLLRLRNGNRKAKSNRLRTLAIIGIFVVFAQISLGGWTSANYAAIICTDFPTCQGHWIPPLDLEGAFQIRGEGINNYLGGFMGNEARVTVHWIHRLGALITTLYLLFLSYSLAMQGCHKYASWLIAVLTMQVTLGISNVLLSLPLHVAVAHNGIAALLLLSMVGIAHNLGQQSETT
jgi:cytochrome c oxidase assembly protein subunit 15